MLHWRPFSRELRYDPGALLFQSFGSCFCALGISNSDLIFVIWIPVQSNNWWQHPTPMIFSIWTSWFLVHVFLIVKSTSQAHSFRWPSLWAPWFNHSVIWCSSNRILVFCLDPLPSSCGIILYLATVSRDQISSPFILATEFVIKPC